MGKMRVLWLTKSTMLSFSPASVVLTMPTGLLRAMKTRLSASARPDHLTVDLDQIPGKHLISHPGPLAVDKDVALLDETIGLTTGADAASLMYLFRRMDSSASMGHLPGRMGLENGWLDQPRCGRVVCIQLHEIRACALHVRQKRRYSSTLPAPRPAPSHPGPLASQGCCPDAAAGPIIQRAVTPRP